MYQGKYKKPIPKRKCRSTRSILVISLVLLGIVVGGTVAYLLDSTNPVTNTFTPAEVKIDPTEATTPTTKSDIKFSNSGTVPVYIRATLVVYWKDAVGNTIPTPAGASVTVPTALGDDWILVGDIYYYQNAVVPGYPTSVMLTDAIEIEVGSSGATCYIDVRAEAIQAEPTNAVEAAWVDVNVAQSGKLVKAD